MMSAKTRPFCARLARTVPSGMVGFWDSWAQKVQSPPAVAKASRPASVTPVLNEAELDASVGRATKDLDQLLMMLQGEDVREHLRAGEQARRLRSRARKLLAILEGSTGGACVLSATDDDIVIDEAQKPPQPPAADSETTSTAEFADDVSDDDLIIEEVTIDSKDIDQLNANSTPAPVGLWQGGTRLGASDEDSDDDLIIEEVTLDPKVVADLKAGNMPQVPAAIAAPAHAVDDESDDDLIVEEVALDPKVIADLKAGKMPSMPVPTTVPSEHATVADDDESDDDLIVEEVTLDPSVIADLKAGKMPSAMALTKLPADTVVSVDDESDDDLIVEEVTLDPKVIADLKAGKMPSLPVPTTVPTEDATVADDDESDDDLIVEEVTLDPSVIADLKAGKMPAAFLPVAVPTASAATDDDASDDDDIVVEEVPVDPKLIAELRASWASAELAPAPAAKSDEADPPEGTEVPIVKEVTLTKPERDEFVRARDAFVNAKHALLPTDDGDDDEEPQVEEISLSDVDLIRLQNVPRPQSATVSLPVVGDGDGSDGSDDEQPLVEEVELSDEEEPVIQDTPLSQARSTPVQHAATASGSKSQDKSADSSDDDEEIPKTPAGLAELRKSIEPIEREFADAPGAKKNKRKKKRRGGKRKGANQVAARPDDSSTTAPVTARDESDDSSGSDDEQDDLDLELTKHWAPSIHQRLRGNRKPTAPAVAPVGFSTARGYVAPISETIIPEPARQQRGDSDDEVPSHGLVSPTPSEDESPVCTNGTPAQTTRQVAHAPCLEPPAPALPAAGAIPRIAASALTGDEFEARFGSPGNPVVITGLGAVDSQSWDLPQFLGLLSHRKRVAARYHGSGFVAKSALWREQHCQRVLNMPAAKFAEQILDGSASSEDVHVVDSLNGTRAGCELERPFQELQALTRLQVRATVFC